MIEGTEGESKALRPPEQNPNSHFRTNRTDTAKAGANSAAVWPATMRATICSQL
jgi:hypothetical protein